MLFSGLLLFSSDPDMYYLNWAFLIKMVFFVSAVIFHYTIHRKAVSSEFRPPTESWWRGLAVTVGRGNFRRNFHRLPLSRFELRLVSKD